MQTLCCFARARALQSADLSKGRDRSWVLTPRTNAKHNARTLKEEEPFCCVRCGEAFSTRSTIERIVERMTGHGMFAEDGALERLRMCADCRVIDMAESVADPMAGGQRPKPRTTEDYLRARERGEDHDLH